MAQRKICVILDGMGVLPIVCALRVMTYNLNYANHDPKGTLDEIAKADADIVLLQEITSEWQRVLSDRFAKQYEHQSYKLHTRSAGGLAILSKVPIKSEEILPSPERGWFPASRLVLDTAFGALQVLNVHLRPAIDGGSWIKGFMTTPPLRLREIETYFPKIAKDMPTIIAGDFNEDPSGTAVGFLEKKGFARVPTTGPTTWRYEVTNHGTTSDLLKMDIDHVMVDGGLVAKDGHVVDGGGSDHRPVIVTVSPKT